VVEAASKEQDTLVVRFNEQGCTAKLDDAAFKR